ncbi:hypothetical protein U879_09530 [Defluviimonas sp. 20V17]|uniref:Tetratricopeptide repeat protein n=1 Tax=Allgaiera indica TaxID=765699 RepID=A0AAN4ZYI4_9RHOB|nr:hypothetical protein U879_09530 [Defluviimonas sp. 20V17]GHD99242.1 hypothetical protein GCM10008024_05840 [Allgaiera indica]
MLTPFDFARHTDARFSAERRAGLAALGAAHSPVELQAARLRLGTLYLAHLMLPEARSLLGAVDSAALPAPDRARLVALRAALRIMQGKPLAADLADSPLAPANRGWPDYPFWAALNAIRAKEGDGIRDNLPAAFARLSAYPRVYAETCLPLFFSAALDIGDWALARRIAERFDAYPELKARPVYDYLLGRAAEGVRRPQRAAQAFGQAAQGEGPFARRALISLVDLGLQEKSLSPSRARVLLEGNLARWQGGTIELDTLRQLVQVDRTLGDWPGMLLTLGQLLRDFPESEDAAPARRQARGLVAAYYKFALEGKVPLGKLLALHRRLIPLYRFDPAFEASAEALAARLLQLGATAMAAQEYARIYDTLRLGAEAGHWPKDPARLGRLKLAEAEAMAAGGRWHAAALALAAVGTLPNGLADRKALLQARVQAALGDPAAAAVAAAQVAAPDPADLRLLAQSAMAARDWRAARGRYQDLRRADPKGFDDTDAINLLLAAWHLGDRATARDVAAAYPDLGGAAHWGRIAGAILDEPATISPLKHAAAQARLAGAQVVIDQAAKATEAGGAGPSVGAVKKKKGP